MTRRGGWEATGFGAALRREREAKGWSRERLAAEAGCAFQTLVKLENGHQEPAWPLACILADVLGVGVERFRVAEGGIEPGPPGRPRKEEPAPEKPAKRQAKPKKGA